MSRASAPEEVEPPALVTPSAGWVDSHCHIATGDVAEARAVVDAAGAEGVDRLVTVGTDASTSRQAVELAEALPTVWATVGLHPHDARHGVESLGDVVAAGVSSGRVVAIGECGLDYHYDHSPREVQQDVFAAQLDIARQHRLPVVVHTREAWDDTLSILDAGPDLDGVVIHCFTGGPEEARRCLDLGAYLSFSGIVTFRNADDVRAAAALCPLDRLLVETDSPYLAPVPHRGRPNSPAHLPLVGAAVAEVKDLAVEVLRHAATVNTEAVLGLRSVGGLP